MTDGAPALIATLRELVAFDTTSARTNQPIIDYLERRLRAAGFSTQRQRYRDDAGVDKENLLARGGRGADAAVPPLALVGHTDCVPYAVQWGEALQLTEKEGRLYARGACDTKGFIACALTAAERLHAQLAQPLLVVFTADEEVGCIGAKRLAEAELGRCRYAIVGEPTSLTPIRAHKGYCLAEVEVRGIEGHSAYPETGASAIFRAGRFLAALESYALTELRAETDPVFAPPYTTVNVGLISGGTGRNVIPGSCRFYVEWRPIPGQPVERVFKKLETIRAQLSALEPGYQAEIKLARIDAGVSTAPDSQLVRFLAAESGKPAATISFGTEAPQLAQLGAEPVVFGPGDIRVAHQTGEFVPVSDLQRCEEILGRALLHFCGPALTPERLTPTPKN